MAPSAYWTADEELAFVDFLVAHKAEAGDGANFKAATFQKAAQHLAPLLERGQSRMQNHVVISTVRCVIYLYFPSLLC